MTCKRLPFLLGVATFFAALLMPNAAAAPKTHVILIGKARTVVWSIDEDSKPLSMKVRPLIVDGRVKEYAIGSPHEMTERLFVIRRAFRVNDTLPEESGAVRWQWQRGGWLMVDRTTGRISPIALPDFDVFYSAISWYRDYAAYCGISDDGKKLYAIVAQLSRRKPLLKKLLATDKPLDESTPDSACPAPVWQRAPARVSFEVLGQAKQTFSIRGHVVDVVNDDEEEDASK